MKQPECDHLDDYLLDWLSPEEASVFEQHLSKCPVCRREYESQRRIDSVLIEAEGILAPIPEGLVARTRDRVRAERRRTARRWALSLAFAASVLAVVAAGHFLANHRESPADARVAATVQTEPLESETLSNGPASEPQLKMASARVAMTDPSAGIVVGFKTRDPQITVVWVYPAVKPALAAGEGADTPSSIPSIRGETP